MTNDHESFERLCHAVMEGKASEADLEQFRQQLRSSAAARKAYAEQMQIHALLTWQQGRAAVPATVVLAPMDFQSAPGIIPFPLSKLLPLRKAVLAAAAVLIIGFAFWLVMNRGQKGAPVAVNQGVTVDILAASQSPYQVGQRLVLERLEMSAGSLRLRISSGAVVDVEGPVALEFVDAMRLRVLRGNITIDVGTEATGFVVDTANTRVLDMGTRFGVSLGDEGNTDIVVFQGAVDVYRAGLPMTRESRLARLVEGEAARISARDAKIQRLHALALRGDLLTIRGLNSPASSVILNVTDNIKKANFYRCYTIVPGGMAEGAPASLARAGHRKITWNSLPGQPFPPELLGADIIGTFQGDRNRLAKTDINLDLARPCAVYVLFDSRAAPPDWLRRDFKATGLRLRSGPWWPNLVETKNLQPDANGELYIVHSVWRKDVSAAETVTLGAPATKREKFTYAMYGIAVKALK